MLLFLLFCRPLTSLNMVCSLSDMQEKTKDDVHPESTGSGEGHEVDTHGKEAGKKEGHVEDKESSLWSGPAPVVDETTR